MRNADSCASIPGASPAGSGWGSVAIMVAHAPACCIGVTSKGQHLSVRVVHQPAPEAGHFTLPHSSRRHRLFHHRPLQAALMHAPKFVELRLPLPWIGPSNKPDVRTLFLCESRHCAPSSTRVTTHRQTRTSPGRQALATSGDHSGTGLRGPNNAWMSHGPH